MLKSLVSLAIVSMFVAGCSDQVTMIPNSDAQLNKSADRFMAEAQACFPYPADAARGGEIAGRANIGYTYNQISLTNFSGSEWIGPIIWVNKSYVIPFERIESGVVKRISFKMIYNEQGERFPLGNKQVRVETLEVFVNGRLYDLPWEIAP